MMRFLRNIIFEDFWLKLFSLVLAVLTWLTVSSSIPKEASPISALNFAIPEHTYYRLPVVVMSSAEDVRNFRVVPNEVAVTVKGEARFLQSVQAKDIRPLVDLTGLAAVGDVYKRIEVSSPPGITLVKVIPPEVRIIFPAKKAGGRLSP
jgi:YbbR domain-containing protein